MGDVPKKRGMGKRAIAFAAALPMLLAVLPATTAVVADELVTGESGQAAVTTDAAKVLDLNFNNSDLTDTSAAANKVAKTKGDVTYVDGVSGKGANFANAAASLGTSDKLQPKNLTLSFWYKPNAAISTEQILMWTKGQYNQDGWYLSANAEAKPLVLSIGAKGTGTQPAEFVMDGKRSEIFKVNTWTHVMVTWDGTAKTAAFYINGIKQSSHTDGDQNAGKTINPTTDTKYIGWNGTHNSAGTLNGVLDEVEMWNVVANTTDVENEVKVGNADFDVADVATDALNNLSIKTQATSNLTLPTSATNGSTIAWISSNEDVISSTGIVTRPAEGEQDATVTLTAVAAYGSKKVTKTFTVTVPAQSSSENQQEYSDKYLSESDMSNVQVADEYLTNAGEKEIKYLLSFEPERLLVEFNRVSGVPIKDGVKNYGGWECGPRGSQYNGTGETGDKQNCEHARFTGHFVGHYLSAISEAQRATFATSEQKAQQLAAKQTELVKGLRTAQQAYAKKDSANAGYLPAFEVSYVPSGSYPQLLVPFYNLHKVEQGLVDAYKYSTDAETREAAQAAAVDFAQWVVNWHNAHKNVNMLSVEYGGMNDALYQVAEIAPDLNSKQVALEAAHLFDETALFEKLAAGQDPLNGLHANTTIPKLTGAMQRYVAYTSDKELYDSLSADEQGKLTSLYLKAAQNFFDIVVNHHTYVNGGNSQSEHFHVSDQLWKDATQNGDPAAGGSYKNNSTVETCNEFNMLKLARLLFQVTRDAKYSEYYEHTFINSILPSQNPETGMTMYFQPMKAGYPKVFGTEYGEFWCCQGTGIENFSKLNDSMWFTDKNDVYVNMFLSSTFTDKRHGLKITQTANVPKQTTVTFKVEALSGADKDASGTANLKLRLPEWTTDAATLNGKKASELTKDANGWLTVAVKAGDTVTYELPAKLQAHTAQDNKNWVAFTYGPYVLAGSLRETDPSSNWGYGGVVVRAAAYDAQSNAMAQIFPKNQSVDEWLKDIGNNIERTDSPNDGKDLSFSLKNVEGAAAKVKLQPYKTLYKTTYAVYWDMAEVDSEAYQQQILSNKAEERESAFNTEAVTSFDNQEQNEGLYNFQRADSTAGEYNGNQYREAKTTGFFSYDLKIDSTAAKNFVGVRLYDGDAARNGFDLWIDPTPVTDSSQMAQGVMSNNAQKFTIKYKTNQGGFYWENVEIPTDLMAKVKDGKVRVKFAANSSTKVVIGGVYGVRTTTAAAYSTDASLKGLKFSAGDLYDKTGDKTQAFDSKVTDYVLKVPADTKSVDATITTQGNGEYVMANGIVIKDGKDNPRTITLDKDVTALGIISVAQDHATSKQYKVIIVKGNATIPEQIANGALEEIGGITVPAGDGNATITDDAERGKVVNISDGWISGSAVDGVPAKAVASFVTPTTFNATDWTLNADVKIADTGDTKASAFTIGTKDQAINLLLGQGKLGYGKTDGGNSEKTAAMSSKLTVNQWAKVSVTYTEEGNGSGKVSVSIDGKQVLAPTDIGFKLSAQQGTKAFIGHGYNTSFVLNGTYDNIVVTADSTPETPKSNDATLKSLKVAGQSVDLTAAASADGAELEVEDPAAVKVADVEAVKNSDKAADPKVEVKNNVVTVTVTAEDGTTKTYKVTLKQKAPAVVPVTSVTVDKSELALKVGETSTLTVTVNPDNAINKTVTWESDNSKVATVTDGGVVSAVAEGTATITATAGGKSATVTVTVSPKETPVPPASDEEFDKLDEAVKAESDAKLDEKNYTADSWKAYQQALANAKEVLANKQSTSEQVKAAADALAAAKQGLVEADSGKEPGGEQTKPGDGENTGEPGGDVEDKDQSDANKSDSAKDDTKDKNANGSSLSRTGAAIVGVALATVVLFGVGVALVSYRKRES